MECSLVPTYRLESTSDIVPCTSLELGQIGAALVEVSPLLNSQGCYLTVLLAEQSLLVSVEAMQGISPLASSLIDNFHA